MGRAPGGDRHVEEPDDQHRREAQAEEQEDQVGVQLGYRARVEPVARGVGAAGVRTAAGDHGPDVEHGPPGEEHRPPPATPRGRGRGSRRGRRRRARGRAVHPASTTAVPTMAREISRWNETIQGFSSVSTVIPPTTAWAGTPRASSRARRRTSRSPDRQASTRVVTATATSTKVTIRLENSIAPWMPSARCGTKEPGVHSGHVGQPRPDPVSRTTPPVTTMAMFVTRDAQAARRSHVGDGAVPAVPARRSRRGGHPSRVRRSARQPTCGKPYFAASAATGPHSSLLSSCEVWHGVPTTVGTVPPRGGEVRGPAEVERLGEVARGAVRARSAVRAPTATRSSSAPRCGRSCGGRRSAAGSGVRPAWPAPGSRAARCPARGWRRASPRDGRGRRSRPTRRS